MNETSFNKEMLTLAREAHGFTQKELADLLGCKQSRLSKIETGDLAPQADDIQAFASALGKNPDFFYQQGEARSSSVSFYRKNITLPLKMLNQCNAQVQVRRLEIENEVGDTRLGNLKLLPLLPPDQNGGPREVARKLRKLWNLPKGPVRCLTKLVEDAGCVIIHFPFPSEKLDGLCVRSSPDKSPIIFLNKDFPKSRRRLSLAHELGHIVMHTNLHENVEEEAWEFAAEFLMPSAEIGKQFYPLDIATLGKLKCQWGVSMQAILQQGKRLQKVGENYHKFLWMQLAKCGYRKNEPFEDAIPDEIPTEIKDRMKPPD